MNRRLLLAGSLRTLRRYKLRSVLMSLGIVIGVAALVVMRSMGTSAGQDMQDKVDKFFGASSVIVMNSGGGMREGVRQPGKLNLEDVEAIGRELDAVINWDPSVYIGQREVLFEDQNRTLMVVGHSERADHVWDRGVSEGEFFTEGDVQSAARVALIGSKAAREIFGTQDPIGKQLRIGTSPFRIKGILEDQGLDPHGLDRDDEIHVPVTTLMRRLQKQDVIGSAKFLIADAGLIDETVEEIADLLYDRHQLANGEPEDFTIYTATQVQKAVQEANRVMTVFLPATAGIALLIAGIVIANIMLIGVRERIAEIGLRKAVGATNGQITGQFLLECLAVTLVSGIAGVALGVGVLMVAARTVLPETRVAPDAVLLGLMSALVVGVLAGYLPARQAALQEPLDALR